MNDNLNNDHTEDPKVNEELSFQPKKIPLIDSIFFSTSTIVIIGAIFLISMFISMFNYLY